MALCENGEWIESYETEVFPYDAGTDSGETFLSEDAATSPHEPISRFGPDDMGIFYNPTECAPQVSADCFPLMRLARVVQRQT